MATIVTRAAKGSPLTHEEVDANFTNLNDELGGLGTAASYDVGTGAGNVVQLNGSGQLPAVDGSLLTGIVSIPSGVITMWSGSIASIPSGWVICDGLNGTPNLTDRFVVGAGSTYAVGGTGGAATVALAEANLPSHTHGTGNYAADSGGTHTHTASSGNSGNHTHTASSGNSGNHAHNGNTSNSGNHAHNGSTSNTGAHTHGVPAKTFSTVSSGAGWRDVGSTTRTNTTNSAGAHSHNFTTAGGGAHSHSFTTAGGGDHSHTITVNSGGDHSHTVTIDSGGAHTHTISGSSGAAGSGSAHENLPPYYALAYIMKT